MAEEGRLEYLGERGTRERRGVREGRKWPGKEEMCLYFVRYLSKKGVIDIDLVGWHMTEVPFPPKEGGKGRKRRLPSFISILAP